MWGGYPDKAGWLTALRCTTRCSSRVRTQALPSINIETIDATPVSLSRTNRTLTPPTTAQGTVRYHIPGKPDVDAKLGDFVSVPVRAPHTFSNPFDEEAKFFNTYTPAFYINYFKLLGSMIEEGGQMTKEKNLLAMANYATLPVPQDQLKNTWDDKKA